MEDKQLTPQESMALISAMIQQSKHLMGMADIRISVMWGILTIITAIMVTVLLVTMRDPVYNYGWFAIPAIGIPLNILMLRGKAKPKARTFTDTVNDTIWKTVGYVGLVLCAACIIFNICGYPQAWLAMYYSAFIIVGFGAVATGAVIKEKYRRRRHIYRCRFRHNHPATLRFPAAGDMGDAGLHCLLLSHVHSPRLHNTP